MTEDISNNISIQVDMILTLADPVQKSYCLLQNMFTSADIDLQVLQNRFLADCEKYILLALL